MDTHLIPQEITDKYSFILDMEVRDYELDCEEIVNNANYLHYMEHTRHKFCQSAGLSFNEMHQKGIDGVVRKVELEYLSPLKSGDVFLSAIKLERKGARFIFHQDIIKGDGTVSVSGKITIVMLQDGKLSRGEEVAEAFKDYL